VKRSQSVTAVSATFFADTWYALTVEDCTVTNSERLCNPDRRLYLSAICALSAVCALSALAVVPGAGVLAPSSTITAAERGGGGAGELEAGAGKALLLQLGKGVSASAGPGEGDDGRGGAGVVVGVVTGFERRWSRGSNGGGGRSRGNERRLSGTRLHRKRQGGSVKCRESGRNLQWDPRRFRAGGHEHEGENERLHRCIYELHIKFLRARRGRHQCGPHSSNRVRVKLSSLNR
jgi:hypothetical protein